jgi:formamidopyrimidine-DNA glycosylase
MPELPEVEFAARNLRKWTRGATIVAVDAPRTRVLRARGVREGEVVLVGARVSSVERRGKWIRWLLADRRRIFSHLGLSGRWLRRAVGAPAEPAERLRLDLRARDRVTSLRYVDPRMFGRFVVAEDDLDEWTSLGPDPLVDPFDGEVLRAAVSGKRGAIKQVLLDQTVLAGVGNIQATEALWRARIDPSARANELTGRQCDALAKAINWTIERTLALEEAPEIQYVGDAGAPNPFLVYGRGGEPCPRCRTVLVRTVLGGRSTALCPRCQR